MIRERYIRKPVVQQAILSLQHWRATIRINQIEPFLSNMNSILDIGSGTGIINRQLRRKGYAVTALDVAPLTIVGEINPVLYDGLNMPFGDRTFDLALLMTVLHHAENPIRVLEEAGRVARHILVIEDLHKNTLHLHYTRLIDSFLNFEFRNHPHNNKNHTSWLKTFDALGFTLKASNFKWTFWGIYHGIYLLTSRGV